MSYLEWTLWVFGVGLSAFGVTLALSMYFNSERRRKRLVIWRAVSWCCWSVAPIWLGGLFVIWIWGNSPKSDLAEDEHGLEQEARSFDDSEPESFHGDIGKLRNATDAGGSLQMIGYDLSTAPSVSDGLYCAGELCQIRYAPLFRILNTTGDDRVVEDLEIRFQSAVAATLRSEPRPTIEAAPRLTAFVEGGGEDKGVETLEYPLHLSPHEQVAVRVHFRLRAELDGRSVPLGRDLDSAVESIPAFFGLPPGKEESEVLPYSLFVKTRAGVEIFDFRGLVMFEGLGIAIRAVPKLRPDQEGRYKDVGVKDVLSLTRWGFVGQDCFITRSPTPSGQVQEDYYCHASRAECEKNREYYSQAFGATTGYSIEPCELYEEHSPLAALE